MTDEKTSSSLEQVSSQTLSTMDNTRCLAMNYFTTIVISTMTTMMTTTTTTK